MATKLHAITLKATGRANVLFSQLKINSVGVTINPFVTNGIWDTGASGTVITQEVVDKLGLVQTGIATVNTASHTGMKTATYLVDIHIKDDLCIPGVKVTVGKIADKVDCLIGMDIIGLGDFSITNFQGKTCMSFRIPSLHEIDYVSNPNQTIAPNGANAYRPRPDDNCNCGSGRKYKYCHGKLNK